METQVFLINLGYNEEIKKYLKFKVIVKADITKVIYLYSLNETFEEYGYLTPVLQYDTKDLLINKNKAKSKFVDIELADTKSNKVKRVKMDFYPFNKNLSFLNEINEKILNEIKENVKTPLEEEYFQKNGVLLVPYDNIIRKIKKDNAVKKYFGVEIYNVKFYRNFIDLYFPKVASVNDKFVFNDNKKAIKEKFLNLSFNEAFDLCENDDDVLNLANNIDRFVDVGYLDDYEKYFISLSNVLGFLKTTMLYIYATKKEKTIQTVIDVLNLGLNIFGEQEYNDFSKNMILYNSENGNGNNLVYLYKRTFVNHSIENIGFTCKKLKEVSFMLEYVEGSANYYKHKATFLEEKMRQDEKEMKQQKEVNKKLTERVKKTQKTMNIIKVIGAGAAGAIGGLTTVTIALFSRKKKK